MDKTDEGENIRWMCQHGPVRVFDCVDSRAKCVPTA